MCVDAAIRLDRARQVLAHAQQQWGIATGNNKQPVLACGNDRAALIDTMVKAMAENGWAAFLGVPDICWEGARARGVDLNRVVCVTQKGPVLPHVCETLVEGFDVVIIGDVSVPVFLQRQLRARARARHIQIITTAAPWQGAQLRIA